MRPAGLECPRCGGSVLLEPQLDGPSEWTCQACSYVRHSELDISRARDAVARRQEGRNDSHRTPRRDSV